MSFPNAFIGNPSFILPGFPIKLGITNIFYFAEGLIKRGMSNAQRAKTVLTSKTQQPCGDCSDCHEMPPMPGDWLYWSRIDGTTNGNYKYVHLETVSLSETYCIDFIQANNYVFIDGAYSFGGSDATLDGYLAGVYATLTYPKTSTYFFQLYGYHTFMDYDFINLSTGSSDEETY